MYSNGSWLGLSYARLLWQKIDSLIFPSFIPFVAILVPKVDRTSAMIFTSTSVTAGQGEVGLPYRS